MLKIKNVTKLYPGSDKGIKNIDMHVRPGDIHAFIGPNGAGKTTLIKAVCAIHPFDEGDIEIGGISIRENPIEAKKLFACIPDNPDIYEYLTGTQFLNFVGDIYEIPNDVRKERILKYADAFEITDALGSLISTYSHGMKQKLMIIASLLHAPRLLILDEPFVGLDPKASVTLRTFMKEICASGGAILFSTHVLEVAQKLSNRVSIINNGEIITSGDMDKIVKEDKTLEDIFMEVAADA
ncbi:MAG: ABC transporter ATP-binding protein [Clostridia bacterium]|nr:ABC transporter ATP-binding protein [Clostridia bacterium]